MKELETARSWRSWVERACAAPETVTVNGSFEEVVAYLTGFYQGIIRQADSVTDEAKQWMALYDVLLARYGGIREQPFSAFRAFRQPFDSDAEALAELASLFENCRHR